MVVADTSSVNYAILIDEIEVLHELYGTIAIPGAVLSELRNPRTPKKVSSWIEKRPQWLEVHEIASVDATPAHLGGGEREAIALAERFGQTLLMDERDGRAEAKQRGLPLTGLIGALMDASNRGLTDLPKALAKLQQTSFHLSPRLLRELLGKT
jgi:predicted nucleic acid-binding protein